MAKANKPRQPKSTAKATPKRPGSSTAKGSQPKASASSRTAKAAKSQPIARQPALRSAPTPKSAKPTKSPASRPQPASAGPKPPRLHAVRPSGSKDDSFFDLVHAIARQIPRGRVTTYGAIAIALGAKGSSRMVGWALISGHHATPFVPCHRVVNRTGLLTGRHHYTPPEQMQQLLEAEGVKVKDSQVVDFKKLFWDPSAEL